MSQALWDALEINPRSYLN